MLKLRLLAHSSEKNRILRLLTRSGACEITEAELPEGLKRADLSDRETEEKLQKLEFGLYFLKEMQKNAKLGKEEKFEKLNFKRENRL